MAIYNLKINGVTKKVDVDPATPVLWVLREHLNMPGTKYGCGVAMCGACTIHLNGAAVRSCQIPVTAVGNKEITTIEGLRRGGELHPLQHSFIEHGAIQCGMCTPGMILSAKALLDETPRPTEAEVRTATSGNLCRCTGYTKIVEAVLSA